MLPGGPTEQLLRTSCCRTTRAPTPTPRWRASASCSVSRWARSSPPTGLARSGSAPRSPPTPCSSEKGEPTVLVITRGFADALRIAYQQPAADLRPRSTLPEVLYDRVIEADERVTACGDVTPLDEMLSHRKPQESLRRRLPQRRQVHTPTDEVQQQQPSTYCWKSIGAIDIMTPVIPPIVKIRTNPKNQSMGVVNRTRPLCIVKSQLKIFTPGGNCDEHRHDPEKGICIGASSHSEEMVQPNDEREKCNRSERPDHRDIAKEPFLRKNSDHFGEDSKTGQNKI